MSTIRIRPSRTPALQVVLWEPRLGVLYKLIVGEPGPRMAPSLPTLALPRRCSRRRPRPCIIRALELPPVSAGADRQQQKRSLVVSPDVVTWDVAVKHLHETRPTLCSRLPSLADAPALPGPLSKNGTTQTKGVLGITEYILWRKTFDDTVDALLEAEDNIHNAD